MYSSEFLLVFAVMRKVTWINQTGMNTTGEVLGKDSSFKVQVLMAKAL